MNKTHDNSARGLVVGLAIALLIWVLSVIGGALCVHYLLM